MNVYHFDRETGEFVATETANNDPKSGLPVLPAYSTSAPPPVTGDDEVAVWDEDGFWSVVENHRGQIVYDGWEVAGVVDYLGPIREGHSLIQAEKPQSVLDAERIQEIKGELAALDMAAVRPLRAVVAGTATTDDTDKLAALESQAATLRAELAALEGQE